MQELDDVKTIIDRLGGDSSIQAVKGVGPQLLSALDDAYTYTYPDSYKQCRNIVFCGMGGSRFPGLIIYALYKDSVRVPFVICDNYILPGFVDEHTLVILSSYSGSTEEVLTCARLAHARSARILGFSVGGALQEWLTSHQYPHIRFDETHNPSRQPRMGFGYAMGATMGILLQLDLLNGSTEEHLNHVRNEVARLPEYERWYGLDNPFTSNPAKALAHDVLHKHPYFVVAEHLEGVGNCIQNQTNETSKNMASYRIIPELNHHLMEGLQFPQSHKSTTIFVCFLSDVYSPRIKQRFEITQRVIEQNGVAHQSYKLRATTPLAQILELLVFSSYFSAYLASLHDVNPEHIPYIDYFKAELNKIS